MSRSKPRFFQAFIALLAIVMATAACADSVDDLVNAELASSKTPGIAVLVMRDGKVLKEQGYGFANLEHRVPVTPETIFQSGSTAKQFTAAGILLLAEEGKLSLDDRLSRHFPDGPASWHRITVRHLLTHTSGLRDYGDEFDYRKDYTEAELFAVMKTLPLDFEPGSQWSYSNSGYLVLGLLTSKLSGMHWSDYQAEKIFKPLGMRTTKVISEKDLVPHRAAGYQLDDDGAIVNQDWIAPSFNRLADGALYFSLRDLAAWERALNQRALLSEAHYTDWWTPVRLSSGARVPYGFGWAFGEQRGQPVIQHGGSWQGFRATVTRYPSQKLAVFVLANAAHAQPEALSHAIAGLVDASLAQLPKAAVQPRGEDGGLSESLRDVLSAWASHGSSEHMAPEMAAIASGSVREASDRLRVARHLSAAKSVTIIGGDALSEAAMDLLDDRSVRAVDALLDTDSEEYIYRFRIDDQDRVVDFSRRPR